jgi:hypothetical protein
MLAIMPMLGWRSHLAHVMQLQAQNVHNITFVCTGINKMCLGTLDTSWMGKWAVMKIKTTTMD